MSPCNWVAVILTTVILCWLVDFLSQVANGSKTEREAYEAKRAQDDLEEMLHAANNEVTTRPRVKAGTHT